MKKIILLLFITTIIFSGCMSTKGSIQKNSNPDPLGAYISGEFPEMQHSFVLKNLDTSEKLHVNFKGENYAQLVQIPPGKYAIIMLNTETTGFFSGGKKYRVQIPYGMMKMLHLNPGEVLYLGRFEYSLYKDLLSLLTKDGGSMQVKMNIEEAFTSIQENYNFKKPIKVVPF